MWSTDKLMWPTFRNLTDSYESWAYRNGLMRRMASLERQQLLERNLASPDDRVYRLTWQGRLHALVGVIHKSDGRANGMDVGGLCCLMSRRPKTLIAFDYDAICVIKASATSKKVYGSRPIRWRKNGKFSAVVRST